MRVHHAKAVQDWLARHKVEIEIFYLPAYAPEHNPDEYLNNDLKQTIKNKPRAKTRDDLVEMCIRDSLSPAAEEVRMKPIRVLVVDDSATMRSLIREMLLRDPAIEVAGEAGDALEARAAIKALNPDVITLDVEMPKMNGLESVSYTHLDVYKRQIQDSVMAIIKRQVLTP